LCTSIPIYFTLSIEGAPFCCGFEAEHSKPTPKGAPFYIASRYRTSSVLVLGGLQRSMSATKLWKLAIAARNREPIRSRAKPMVDALGDAGRNCPREARRIRTLSDFD
jgi:hypothetical protein